MKEKFYDFIENKKGVRRLLVLYVSILYLIAFIVLIIKNPVEAMKYIQVCFLVVLSFYFGTRFIEKIMK